MLTTIEREIMLGIEDLGTSVCGGRQFGRKFSKKDFPLLGDDNEEDSSDTAIVLSRLAKERMPKKLSMSVTAVRDLCRDPHTGKWQWPQNGADLVHPKIYLGDA